MIDAERMLGSLVRNAMGGGSRRGGRRGRRGGAMRGLAKGGLAMGALGVAIAAFEHFSKQGQSTAVEAPNLPPVPGTPASSAALPPIPGQAAAGSAPLPPLPNESSSSGQALLLVRAMIAAANADQHLDDKERSQILQALDESGLGSEERDYLLAEIESPVGLESLAAEVETPDQARQLYLASLMAIEVDSEAERNYLRRLAERLDIGQEGVEELEGLLGEP